jgi:hypothetical protein
MRKNGFENPVPQRGFKNPAGHGVYGVYAASTWKNQKLSSFTERLE